MAGAQNPSAAILLVDSVGDKGGLFRRKKDQNVLRGSLLLSIPPKDAPNTADGKPAYNYRVAGDDTMMYCSEQDLAPVTRYEFDLLNGVKSAGARYDAFVNDIMDWGSKLGLNDTVYVSLPSQKAIENKRCRAVVRWIGLLPGEEGTKFGVELLEEQHRGRTGTSNGFFRGQQLFVCDEDCGMFVALDKLAKSADFPATVALDNLAKSADFPATRTEVLPKTIRDNLSNLGSRLGLGKSNESQSSSSSSGPSANTRSHVQKTNAPQFKVGDRVVTYNKQQVPIHGTVKTTGGQTHSNSGKLNVVGIETDVSVQKEDFPIVVTGFRSTFKCDDPRHGKVILPESLVQLEKEVMEERNRKKQTDLSKQHEDSHRFIQQDEQKMLRDARIESQALDPEEQEKLFREYNQQRDEQLKDRKLGSTKNRESSSQDNVPIPRQLSSQEQSKSTSAGRGKGHLYDEIASIHHSNSAGNLQQQSQSNNPASSQYQDEAMLRDAKIETRALDKDEQERLFQEYKQKQDEQRKVEAAGSRNPLGSNVSHLGNESSVDPPGKYRSSSSTYQNMPLDRAYAPPQDDLEQQFVMGSRVQFSDPPRYGVIRWMGNLPQVAGLIAGVELEEDMKGCFDGTWKGIRYFSCKHGHGFFSPVSNLRPDQRVVTQQTSNTPPLYRQPSAQPPGPSAPAPVYGSEAEQGSTVPPAAYREPIPNSASPSNISVGSAVEIGDTRNPHYGTLRWMGILPGHEELVAGIEMEEDTQRCGDGYLDGVQYFKCPYGRAYFCPLMQVRRDTRFADSAPPQGLLSSGNPLQKPMEELLDQQVPPLAVYVGDQRGIQGHQNSCYLDSTLFGLFALSDIFDEMFLEVTTSLTIDPNRRAISEMLWKGIVNPLRKNGVVRYESVMMMRNKLDELGKMEGIAEKEKDPEEFLNMLFKHVLRVSPFISIRRPFGVEPEFFVQLFVEHDPNLKQPTVGILLGRMFKEQQISFTAIPSKLLLQVPRFGREFKTYNKIIPDLKLDILELTDTAQVPECMFCGERSTRKCSDCSKEFTNSQHVVDGSVHFCRTCSDQAHKKKSRVNHKHEDAIDPDKLELYKLDLLSVICIETSHYVCFTRDVNTETWIFFDSMANRVYDTYNIPKVTDCTHDLNEWVYSGDRTRLMSTQPRQLPELVRRFTQDIYMCVYIQPDVALYGDGQ